MDRARLRADRDRSGRRDDRRRRRPAAHRRAALLADGRAGIAHHHGRRRPRPGTVDHAVSAGDRAGRGAAGYAAGSRHSSCISSSDRSRVSGTLRRIQMYETHRQITANRAKVWASPIASTIVRKNCVTRKATPQVAGRCRGGHRAAAHAVGMISRDHRPHHRPQREREAGDEDHQGDQREHAAGGDAGRRAGSVVESGEGHGHGTQAHRHADQAGEQQSSSATAELRRRRPR